MDDVEWMTMNDNWIKKQWQWMTMNDNEWQWMTMNDNELQWMTMNYNDLTTCKIKTNPFQFSRLDDFEPQKWHHCLSLPF